MYVYLSCIINNYVYGERCIDKLCLLRHTIDMADHNPGKECVVCEAV